MRRGETMNRTRNPLEK